MTEQQSLGDWRGVSLDIAAMDGVAARFNTAGS